jgi:uncharacterized protein (DUF1015 family)
MPEVRPFTGLLYDPGVAGSFGALTAPPYDVISPMDQGRYYQASPFNVVRLILGRDEPGDDGSKNKYTRAASYLRRWRIQGVVRATDRPSLYPYQLDFQVQGRPHRVRGLIAEVGLEGRGGPIVAHERTFPGPLEDRLQLLRSVRANLSPVYSLVEGPVPELSRFLDAATDGPPDREMTDQAGARHRLWVAAGSEGQRAIRALSSRTVMIADGHHRFAVATAYRDEMRAQSGPGPWDFMMMMIVDAATEDPPVLPIHRLVRGIGSPVIAGDHLVRDTAEILATLSDDALTYGIISREAQDLVHRVASLEGSPPTVCALHERILDQAEELEVRFVPDAFAAERAVAGGESEVAFLLPPTRVERVWEVVRSGRRLPQKSTYFWPKPRTGMVIRPVQP